MPYIAFEHVRRIALSYAMLTCDLDCCRYILNYTVTDSQGLSAEPLQLTVIIYEAAQVQASLQLISQIPYTGVAAKAQARTNIRQLTDVSGSTANTAFRSVA